MQELILLKHVDKLGRPGGVVRVKNGYANNYLLPQGLAVRATKENMRRLQGLRARFEEEEKQRVERAKALSERISKTMVEIAMKASEEGHLYGSVTAAMIVESLAAQGIEIEVRQVRLAEPIKSIGRYEVPIHLHDDHKCDLKVWVVEEKEVDAEVAPVDSEPAESSTGA